MVPIIQSFAQLEKNYGKEGSSIIIDNCQDIFVWRFLHQTQRAQKSYQKHWETERCCLVLYPEEKMTPARACK